MPYNDFTSKDELRSALAGVERTNRTPARQGDRFMKDGLDLRLYLPWAWDLWTALAIRSDADEPKLYGLPANGWDRMPARLHDPSKNWPRYIGVLPPLDLNSKKPLTRIAHIKNSYYMCKVLLLWRHRQLASEKLLADPLKIIFDPHQFVVTDERIDAESWDEQSREDFFDIQRAQFRNLLRWDVDSKMDVFR